MTEDNKPIEKLLFSKEFIDEEEIAQHIVSLIRKKQAEEKAREE